MTLSQTALYSWAGEKFAWLALHPLLPATLLAGIGAEAGVQRLRRTTPARRVGAAAAFVALAVATTVVAIRPAVTDGADPRELLVTVQTSVDVPPLAAQLRAAMQSGEIDSILVDLRTVAAGHGSGTSTGSTASATWSWCPASRYPTPTW